MQPLILPFKNKLPTIGKKVFIAPSASVVGDVALSDDCNIWYNVTLRGDVHYIRIGARTNIQDNVVGHVTTNKFPLLIGEGVTVGHSAILHGCTVHDGALIGMGAKILDGAIVEKEAFIAAGALISPGKVVESGWLWAGVPAKPVRKITADERKYLQWSAKHYVALGREHALNLPIK